jgi:lipopolysaccharide heptosyltransferase II
MEKSEMLLENEKIQTVLVLMMDRHLGNLVVSLSVMISLAKYFQDCDVHFALDSAYKEVVETVDGLGNIIYFPRREIYGSSLLKRTMLYLRFIHDLRSTHCDATIDLQGGDASSIATLLSGASHRVGKSNAKRPYIYNKKVDLPVGKHKVHSYTKIAEALGARIDDPYYRLHSSVPRRDSLNKSLKLQGVSSDRPIISVHAGAGNIHKQWTTEGFTEITDWLFSEGFQVVFVGADRDLDKTKAIMSKLNHKAYDLGGSLSLGELMALFEMSSLFLGNDSGPMHLAAAVGTPVVGLFGPVDEKRWRPLSPNSAVLRGHEPCEDCRNQRKNCHDFPCITTLPPDKVKQAISELLATGKN